MSTEAYVPKSFAEFKRRVQSFQLVQTGSIASGEFVPFPFDPRPAKWVFEKRSKDFQMYDGSFIPYGKAAEWTFAPGVATHTHRTGSVRSYIVTYN